MIGGVFGCVFLIANARTPLGDVAADVFRAVGVSGLVALMIGRQRAVKNSTRQPTNSDAGVDLFGRRWRLIVAAEVAALTAGFAVIGLIGAPRETFLPWTVLVVGLHFIALHWAGVWHGHIMKTGVALALLGVIGLGLTAASHTDWVPLVSGVFAGLLLLAGSISAMRRAL